MYVACSTLSFSKVSLEDALRTVREMRFTKADLAIHDDGPHLTPVEVATDHRTHRFQRLKTANLPLAAIHLAQSAANTTCRTHAGRPVPASRSQLSHISSCPGCRASPRGSPIGSDLPKRRCADSATRLDRRFAEDGRGDPHYVRHALGNGYYSRPAQCVPSCHAAAFLTPALTHRSEVTTTIGPHGTVDYDGLCELVRHVRLRHGEHARLVPGYRIGQAQTGIRRRSSPRNSTSATSTDLADRRCERRAGQPDVPG